jgi:hypothetical protein
MGKLAADVRERVQKIRQFVFSQSSVPQGGARSLTFIDSRLLQEAIAQQRNFTSLPALAHPAAESNYPEVYRLGRSEWTQLLGALEVEHAATGALLNDLRKVTNHWAIDSDELSSAGDELTRSVKAFLESARAAAKACVGARQSMGRPELLERILDLPPAKVSSWTSCLAQAVDVETAAADAMLTMDVGPLQKLHVFVLDVDKACQQLAHDVEAQMAEVVTPTEVEAERARAYEAVQRLIATIDNHSDHQPAAD